MEELKIINEKEYIDSLLLQNNITWMENNEYNEYKSLIQDFIILENKIRAITLQTPTYRPSLTHLCILIKNFNLYLEKLIDSVKTINEESNDEEYVDFIHNVINLEYIIKAKQNKSILLTNIGNKDTSFRKDF